MVLIGPFHEAGAKRPKVREDHLVGKRRESGKLVDGRPKEKTLDISRIEKLTEGWDGQAHTWKKIEGASRE